ncbi:NADP-dependent oxidoreductase [Pseudomonas sp. BN414]|uniref:NADP-dependent oxidoreductase n=1 Tax=Pseudomonas sp. BN414 TaxID=2567888 RepID=UPI00245671AD|nr:NADP-dependent oxidoreductase [Pseudomonas sp. BN414]
MVTKSMKAVRVAEYGDEKVLKVAEVPVPTPQPGQVLLKVLACGVNPLDAWFRSGHLAARFPRQLPYTPGVDVIGEVVERGEEAVHFEIGERLMGILSVLSDGGYAEYAVAEANTLIRLPNGLDPVQAAAGMLPSVTGFQLVDKALSLGSCRRMLVLGALGSVGRAAVAAALARGLDVTAVVLPQQRDEAKSLGAQHVETDSARSTVLAGEFDCLLDTVGPQVVSQWEMALAEGGHVISIVPLPPASFTRQNLNFVPFAFRPEPSTLAEVARLMQDGKLQPPPIRTVPLHETADAHRVLLGGANGEKFIVVPTPNR